MKKLHILILKSFMGPFFATFFVALFVLLMQFLWKYVDYLVGKGLDGLVIGELIFYSSASLIPMALPLAILLSSIMTFGNLGEHFEMVAIKAAGIPIRRVFAPMVVLMVLISVAAFFTSNFLIPKANLKSKALLYDVKNQKPSLLIKEGIFNSDIEGYSIRIGKKDADNETIHDIVIYDNMEDISSGRSVIVAESGKMAMSEDKRYLFLDLYRGKRYEDMLQRDRRRRNFPHNIVKFDEEHLTFDLSAFSFTRTSEDLFKDSYHLLNVVELETAADSVVRLQKETMDKMPEYATIYYKIFDSTYAQAADTVGYLKEADVLKNFPGSDKGALFNTALNSARSVKSIADFGSESMQSLEKLRTRYWVEWHRKYTLSIACLVLFFIGAPLGTIIRKGGFGMPVVFSVILFVIYHILSMMGDKFARQMILTPFAGMWLSTFLLSPFGAFLTYKASIDSNLFSSDMYSGFFDRIKGLFKKKKQNENTVPGG